MSVSNEIGLQSAKLIKKNAHAFGGQGHIPGSFYPNSSSICHTHLFSMDIPLTYEMLNVDSVFFLLQHKLLIFLSRKQMYGTSKNQQREREKTVYIRPKWSH